MTEGKGPEKSVSKEDAPTPSLRDRLRLLREKERASSKPLQSLSLTSSAADDMGSPLGLLAPTAEVLASSSTTLPTGELNAEAAEREFEIPDAIQAPVASTREDDEQAQPSFVSPRDLQLYREPPPSTVNPTDVLREPVPVAYVALDHEPDSLLERGLAAEHAESVLPNSEKINLGDAEFAVPLPMDSRIRDEYDALIAKNRSSMRRFLDVMTAVSSSPLNEELREEMISLIDKLNNVCSHPDINRATKSIERDAIAETKWAEYSSAKFEFLGHLIRAASTEDMHITIFSKPGKSLHLLETYLLGRGFIRKQPPCQAPSQEACFSKLDLSFGLRSTADEIIRVPPRPPSIIIAFDATFNPDNTSVYTLRSSYVEDEGQLIPVVRLIIFHSSEHIERCLPPVEKPESALKFFVQRIDELSEGYVRSPYNAYDLQNDADRVIEFAKSDSGLRWWPLPYIGIPQEWIDGDGVHPDHGVNFRSTLTIGEKHLLDEENPETNVAKKQKIASSWIDVAQLGSTAVKAEGRIPKDSLAPAQPAQDMGTDDPDEILRQLKAELAENRAFLKALQTDFAKLQYRYETKHNSYHKMRQNLEKSLRNTKRLEDELQRLKQDNAALRDERVKLRGQYEELRDTKKSESEMANALIEAKEATITLQKENASLKRQTEQERAQAEYTRIQYQNASSAAAQSALENRQLEDKIGQLQEQAEGRAVQLKQMRMNDNEKTHLARIAELEMLLDTRDRILSSREEELHELKKNRPSTRATSNQPRSTRGPSPANYNHNGHSTNGSTSGSSIQGGSSLRYRMQR
ncbi:hypothetical protein KEM54_000333 [Ascosphaera aggregata]|nr:hypothetical protein KEM54_000333 [Ascosphaera aggregata]